MKNKQNKAREELIKMYIDSLEEGQIPWRQGWNDLVDTPRNPVTNTKYHGVNLLMLTFKGRKLGYEDPRWCTLKQANEKGWRIEKGQHGTPVEYWMPYDKEERKYLTWKQYQEKVVEARKKGEELTGIVLYCKISYAFNAKQIVGIPEYVREANEQIETAPFVENLIQNMNVNYMETGDEAYYSPDKDMVVIPERTLFENDYEYNSTRLHELCHATGHASRLERPVKNLFGSIDYAKEELRAEIASSFIGQTINLKVSDSNLDNHKAYIQSWIEVLNKEPEELFKAIKDAQKIESYVLNVGEWEMMKEHEKETKPILGKLESDMNYCDSVFRIKEKLDELMKNEELDQEVISIVQGNEEMYHQEITENMVNALKEDRYNQILKVNEDNFKCIIFANDELYIQAINKTLGLDECMEEQGQSI